MAQEIDHFPENKFAHRAMPQNLLTCMAADNEPVVQPAHVQTQAPYT